MKSYLSLVPISARVHRHQSRMTRICIILAVFLVTTLFSMADMWLRAEKTEMINRHGNYHMILRNVPENEAELIGKHSNIAVISWLNTINPNADQNYAINGKKTILYGIEKTYLTDIRAFSIEGSYPQNDNEILLSIDAKNLFEVGVNDTITLNTPAGDFHYIISGFCEDDTEFNNSIDGICMYMNRNTFYEIYSLNGVVSEPVYYIQFQDNVNFGKAIADIKEQYSLANENVEENMAVLGLSGASSNKIVKNIYLLAGIASVLILISGILMISSCINSNVAQRTKFFGMLRCIGASKQQIIRFVRLEALNWCKTAIPTGCLLGVVINWILCAILRLLIKGEFADMPLFGVSIISIICGAAIGVITVFIAAHSPAKQAAKVSPVAAVSGNFQTAKNIRHAANIDFFKVETTLGIHHAISAKKNLFLMTGSFALTIILFLTFSACLDLVRRLLPSLNNFAPDIGIVSQDNMNSIDKSLPDEISKLSGVDYAFGTMMAPNTPVEINGNAGSVDLASYEEYMLNFSKKSIVSGDLAKVYGDSDYVLTIFSQDSRLDVGDKIKINGYELEIACVLSFGIGGVSEGIPTVICSEETFTRLMGEQNYLMVNVIFTRDATETTVNAIHTLAGENLFTDRREEYKVNHNSYWVFRIAAYGFLAIISFITVLNIMNSISMSVFARIKQYGAMRAVGMESRQVTKMIAAEAATYAVCGTIVGHIFGLLLHYLFYKKIIIAHFGGKWDIPIIPVAIIVLIVFASCIAAVYAPSKHIQNMAITDTINDL